MELITTIEFKSTEDNYRKEVSGIKSNTVRIFDCKVDKEDIEAKVIEQFRKTIKYIHLYCTDGIQSCVRELTDITRFESHGVIIYIFSW